VIAPIVEKMIEPVLGGLSTCKEEMVTKKVEK
jgi:hypothetical protein